MDFGQINTAEDSNLGATYHVVDPYTDEPAYSKVGKAKEDVPVTITVLGPDSDKMRQHQNQVMRSMMKRRKGLGLDATNLEQKMTAQLVEAVIGWQGILIDGEAIECNRDNVHELFSKHYWLREQLLGFQQERANFLKK